MKERSRSGQYIAIQDASDPGTFQSWPIYFCPDYGHMMVLYRECDPVFCTECDDDTAAWQPRGAEEGEPECLQVTLAKQRRAKQRVAMARNRQAA